MFGFLSKVTDPVCGMRVDKSKTQFSSKMNEEVYYFCSQSCKEKFGADSKKYLGEEASHAKECCH